MHKHHGLLTGPTRPPSNIFSSKGPACMLMICLMHSRWICKIKMKLKAADRSSRRYIGCSDTSTRFTVSRWREPVEAAHCKKKINNQKHKNDGEFHKHSGPNIIFLCSLKCWSLQQSDISTLGHISGIFTVFIFRDWSSIGKKSAAGLLLELTVYHHVWVAAGGPLIIVTTSGRTLSTFRRTYADLMWSSETSFINSDLFCALMGMG